MWARVPASILVTALLPVEYPGVVIYHLAVPGLGGGPAASCVGLVTTAVKTWLQLLARKPQMVVHHSNIRIIPGRLDICRLLWAADTGVTKELLKYVQAKLGLGTMVYLQHSPVMLGKRNVCIFSAKLLA